MRLPRNAGFAALLSIALGCGVPGPAPEVSVSAAAGPGAVLEADSFADPGFARDLAILRRTPNPARRASRDHSDDLLLLEERKFDALEENAARLRSEKTRYVDGDWVLPAWYSALGAKSDWPENRILRRLEALEAWRLRRPDSPTPLILLGHAWTSYAWSARGDGWASEVSDRGWTLFSERLKRAEEFYERAESMTARCPELHRGQMILATAQGRSRVEIDALFAKAVSREPLYDEYYFQMATYLLPRWHGAEGEWIVFARDASDSLRDRIGQEMYPRIIQRIWGNAREDVNFRVAPASWPRMRRGLLDLVDRNGDSNWALNIFAWYACRAGDKETARAVFARIDRPDLDVWDAIEIFENWKRWAG